MSAGFKAVRDLFTKKVEKWPFLAIFLKVMKYLAKPSFSTKTTLG